MMNLNDQGITLIKNFEGLRLNAYRDIAGIWTIGYGSTRYHDGKAVKSGDKLTGELQASALLLNTLNPYISSVNRFVKVPLNQNQFNALVSFTYNEGIGALERSTLLQKLNMLDYAGTANQLLLWDKITDPKTGKKVVCKALTNRRKRERELFLKSLV
jgi:lysozyme